MSWSKLQLCSFFTLVSVGSKIQKHQSEYLFFPIPISVVIVSILCINLGNLLDNPSLESLPNPDQHSVHCLADVQDCVDSGYRILVKPPGYQSGDNYLQDVQLDDTGNSLVVAEARRLGSCGTCDGTGNLTQGFAATIVGTLDEDAIPGSEQEVSVDMIVPPTLTVTEVLPLDTPCPEAPPTEAPSPTATPNSESTPSPTTAEGSESTPSPTKSDGSMVQAMTTIFFLAPIILGVFH